MSPRCTIKISPGRIVWQYMLILNGANGATKDASLRLLLYVKQEVSLSMSFLGPVHANAFSLSKETHRSIRAHTTVLMHFRNGHTTTFENDRVERCDVSWTLCARYNHTRLRYFRSSFFILSCVYICDDCLSYNFFTPQFSRVYIKRTNSTTCCQLACYSSIGRALHRYRSGQGSRTRLDFLRLSFRNCKSCVL